MALIFSQKTISVIIAGFTSLTAFSQKKELTTNQLLKNELPSIVTPLPTIISWETDDRLVLGSRIHPDSVSKTFLFDPKTVKEMLYAEEKKAQPKNIKKVYFKNTDLYFNHGSNAEIELTNDKEKEFNPTLSPDSNYVAYTKKNNLYVIDLTTKRETQLMLYPGGRHGWGGNKGLHFLNLKTKFIYKYLLEKPVPQELLR